MVCGNSQMHREVRFSESFPTANLSAYIRHSSSFVRQLTMGWIAKSRNLPFEKFSIVLLSFHVCCFLVLIESNKKNYHDDHAKKKTFRITAFFFFTLLTVSLVLFCGKECEDADSTLLRGGRSSTSTSSIWITNEVSDSRMPMKNKLQSTAHVVDVKIHRAVVCVFLPSVLGVIARTRGSFILQTCCLQHMHNTHVIHDSFPAFNVSSTVIHILRCPCPHTQLHRGIEARTQTQ